MKPIVPGCTCIVINSVAGNNGAIVTAIKYVGSDFMDDDCLFRKGRTWEIDKKLSAVNNAGEQLEPDYYIPEYNLRRLDDYEPTEAELNENIYEQDKEKEL